APREELLRDLTGLFALCQRAEVDFSALGDPSGTLARCHFCPLFHQLGGGEREIGCNRSLNPLLEHARRERWEPLRAGIAEIIEQIRRMPLPA
ncbi:MAG TPA: hypothetical protein VFU47_04515, partial [Armatimonadota bacterium]|nr:hypothetical protein [Armatimonadota bacterium]